MVPISSSDKIRITKNKNSKKKNSKKRIAKKRIAKKQKHNYNTCVRVCMKIHVYKYKVYVILCLPSSKEKVRFAFLGTIGCSRFFLSECDLLGDVVKSWKPGALNTLDEAAMSSPWLLYMYIKHN